MLRERFPKTNIEKTSKETCNDPVGRTGKLKTEGIIG